MSIKKFDELLESYDSPVNINWTAFDGKLVGIFLVRGVQYQISCLDKGYGVWTYKFYVCISESNELSPNLTNNDVGKLSILSTIRDGMKYLIETKNPKSVIFGAFDKSEGRKKLYWRYSEELKNEYDFKLLTKNRDDKQIFILYKQIEIDDLLKIIDVIVSDVINEI